MDTTRIVVRRLPEGVRLSMTRNGDSFSVLLRGAVTRELGQAIISAALADDNWSRVFNATEESP